MDAHIHCALIMTVLSMFILTLAAAAVAAADNVASFQLRNVLGALSASPVQRNYLPLDESFEHRQLRNGKYMRFGRDMHIWDQSLQRSLEEQPSSNMLTYVNSLADRGTNVGLNKRTGGTEDIDEFMRFGKRMIGSEQKGFKSFNTMMRFGKRDDVADLFDSGDEGQRSSNNLKSDISTTQQQLGVNEEIVKRGRPSSESGSQFMRFGK